METFVPPTERPDEFEYPDDLPQPQALSGRTRARFRDWWRGQEGMRWLWIEAGSWREFGWRWHVEHHGWQSPFRLFYLRGKLAELRYYIACRLWRRYNAVTARTEPPTWRDRSEFLLPVMMQVLTDFVECERPFEHFATGWHYDAWYAIRDLYEWWHVRRPARERATEAALAAWHDEFQRLGGLGSEPTDNPRLNRMTFPSDRDADTTEERRLFAAHRALEVAGEEEDEAMMIRLVRLRGHLWT